ncbi:hypothetical protein Cni_G04284 [Canna indica]|uniref:HMA domain-containing protein n=1 Tax=Canna indica TaxID=4628 RepID=A0AAQ3JT88_9LILI|nr:hypothetical protein Cni_G04284 [Canna indica]
MAKEEDLKRVELKVSVNCCEGCKRKVLKALSIRGVLRTEIHPTLPKVTVIGNVDVQVLVKKLAKAGKTAEITLLVDEAAKPDQEGDHKCCEEASEKKKSSKKGKDEESSSSSSSEKCSAPENEKSQLDSAAGASGNGEVDSSKSRERDQQDVGDKEAAMASTPVNHSVVQNVTPVMASQARVFYPMEPVAVPMQYYATNAYPHPSSPYYIQEHYYSETAAAPTQATAFGDYFNDDNAVGCRIM